MTQPRPSQVNLSSRRKATPTACLATAALLVLLAPAAAEPPAPAPSISISPIRTVPVDEAPGRAKELTVTVQSAAGEEPRHFVVRGPDKLMDLDDPVHARVVGARLLVHTSSVIAVFDLASGEQLVYRVAAPEVVVSPDGRRVAFETLQLPFTPAEATSPVIQVLDLVTLETEPVFPEASLVHPSQFGSLLAWIDDPQDRHSIGPLAFSADGAQLTFRCTHSLLGSGEPKEAYEVVVDLAGGLAESRFVHRAVASAGSDGNVVEREGPPADRP